MSIFTVTKLLRDLCFIMSQGWKLVLDCETFMFSDNEEWKGPLFVTQIISDELLDPYHNHHSFVCSTLGKTISHYYNTHYVFITSQKPLGAWPSLGSHWSPARVIGGSSCCFHPFSALTDTLPHPPYSIQPLGSLCLTSLAASQRLLTIPEQASLRVENWVELIKIITSWTSFP